jgi:hypothetical protein
MLWVNRSRIGSWLIETQLYVRILARKMLAKRPRWYMGHEWKPLTFDTWNSSKVDLHLKIKFLSHTAHILSVTKTSLLMLLREIIVCVKRYTKRKYNVWSKFNSLFNVKLGRTCSNHSAVKIQRIMCVWKKKGMFHCCTQMGIIVLALPEPISKGNRHYECWFDTATAKHINSLHLLCPSSLDCTCILFCHWHLFFLGRFNSWPSLYCFSLFLSLWTLATSNSADRGDQAVVSRQGLTETNNKRSCPEEHHAHATDALFVHSLLYFSSSENTEEKSS